MNNPFGLVYEGAITENLPGRVQIRPVTYEVEGIRVAANLYLPADCDESGDVKYPAVAVAHPNGGCKEQVAGLYAQRLAESGFIALACDARYQGESGGEPRLRDYPANRVEDISGMVDYLTLLPMVDAGRIGALGICGAAATRWRRRRPTSASRLWQPSPCSIPGACAEMAFWTAPWIPLGSACAVPPRRVTKSSGAMCSTRASFLRMPPTTSSGQRWRSFPKTPFIGMALNPNATGSYTTASFMKLMAFDVEDRMGLIDQPLLMIAGEKADTLYMTQDAFDKATGTDDKELCLIEGASHIRTYWVKEYVNKAVSKLDTFFKDNL